MLEPFEILSAVTADGNVRSQQLELIMETGGEEEGRKLSRTAPDSAGASVQFCSGLKGRGF